MPSYSNVIIRAEMSSSWNFKPNENQYHYSIEYGIVVKTNLKKGAVCFQFNYDKLFLISLIINFLIINSKFIEFSTLKINNSKISLTEDEIKIFYQAKPYLTDNNKCEFWFSHKEDIIIELLEECVFDFTTIDRYGPDLEFSQAVLEVQNLGRKAEGLPPFDIKKSQEARNYRLIQF